jgi:hypothetical protein
MAHTWHCTQESQLEVKDEEKTTRKAKVEEGYLGNVLVCTCGEYSLKGQENEGICDVIENVRVKMGLATYTPNIKCTYLCRSSDHDCVPEETESLRRTEGSSAASKVLRKHSLLETGSKNRLIPTLVGWYSTVVMRNGNDFRTRRRRLAQETDPPHLAIMILHSRAPSPSSSDR